MGSLNKKLIRMKKVKSITGILFLLFTQRLYAQTANEEKAKELAKEAIELENHGGYDPAIKLLKEAHKLNPKNNDYPYELAYAYYEKKNYSKAVNYLESIAKDTGTYDLIFQLLGNCYDNLGKTEKALKAYDEGLKLFPKSGNLYLEKGNIYWIKKDYNQALVFYEEGIEADPQFASNYYRAALLYCSSSEKLWGVLYAEMFMNLEFQNMERNSDISQLLYKMYQSSIVVDSNISGRVAFGRSVPINPEISSIPFSRAYGSVMTLSLPLETMAAEKTLSLYAINKLRTTFIENWFSKEKEAAHSNQLLNYNRLLLKAGLLEPYNYFIFAKGNEKEFETWKKNNPNKWDEFVKWTNDHPLKIEGKDKFCSNQY
jgi:tetratricopeptide (TPR) repeat protein